MYIFIQLIEVVVKAFREANVIQSSRNFMNCNTTTRIRKKLAIDYDVDHVMKSLDNEKLIN
jgi:hypothetical protein